MSTQTITLKNTPSHTPATVRETVLDTAKQYICGDREASYGSPETNFRAVANLWIDYLAGYAAIGGELTAKIKED